jgi:hypothetical protein
LKKQKRCPNKDVQTKDVQTKSGNNALSLPCTGQLIKRGDTMQLTAGYWQRFRGNHQSGQHGLNFGNPNVTDIIEKSQSKIYRNSSERGVLPHPPLSWSWRCRQSPVNSFHWMNAGTIKCSCQKDNKEYCRKKKIFCPKNKNRLSAREQCVASSFRNSCGGGGYLSQDNMMSSTGMPCSFKVSTPMMGPPRQVKNAHPLKGTQGGYIWTLQGGRK